MNNNNGILLNYSVWGLKQGNNGYNVLILKKIEKNKLLRELNQSG